METSVGFMIISFSFQFGHGFFLAVDIQNVLSSSHVENSSSDSKLCTVKHPGSNFEIASRVRSTTKPEQYGVLVSPWSLF